MAAALVLACVSCTTGSSAPKKVEVEVVVSVHDHDTWYDYRGASLGLSRADTLERDRAFDRDNPPPSEFWDAQVAIESASIWRVMCNECHRGQRRIATAANIPAPAEGWGQGSGRFFGRERPYRDIHLQISIGGAAKPEIDSRMPGFADELSNEQIWGLVHFVERASEDLPNR
jgi:hypothetical protein